MDQICCRDQLLDTASNDKYTVFVQADEIVGFHIIPLARICQARSSSPFELSWNSSKKHKFMYQDEYIFTLNVI